MKKLSKKEIIIQDALGTLPEWHVTFKIKSSKDVAHWRSDVWESTYYYTYYTIAAIKTHNKKGARKRAIKILKKDHKPFKVKFRTYFIAET